MSTARGKKNLQKELMCQKSFFLSPLSYLPAVVNPNNTSIFFVGIGPLFFSLGGIGGLLACNAQSTGEGGGEGN